MLPFFITGPTASGKSAIALALAERIGGEIVNADAFQLYEGLPLLTAKPPQEDLARVPHHLYAVLSPAESCDAQRYRELALPVLADIAARGRQAIVVGGSGLYLKALSHGLAELPRGDEALRAELRALPLAEGVARLLALDPQAADNVPLANPRYVQRALEICLLTGLPQSLLRQTFAQAQPQGQGIVIQWPREILHERIDRRVHAMMNAGLLEEVVAFDAWRAPPQVASESVWPFEKAIGLKEVRTHLAGGFSLAEAVASMQQATRRYAKRQITWFKRESWLQTICLDSSSAADSCLSHLLDLFPCLTPPPPRTSSPFN